jgi:hypothetical protein
MAQLERNNMWAMRANWGSNEDLHDRLADLLGKTENGEYFPNGEWWLYKYYYEMKGERVATKVSSDMRFDVFATRDKTGVKILAGTRTFEDIWDVPDYEIEVAGLGSVHDLPKSGKIEVQSWRFDYEGNQTEIGPPVNLGRKEYDLIDGAVSHDSRPRPGCGTNCCRFGSSTAQPRMRQLMPLRLAARAWVDVKVRLQVSGTICQTLPAG